MSKLDELLLNVRDCAYEVCDFKMQCPLRKLCDEIEEKDMCSKSYCICEEADDKRYLKIIKECLKDE